MDTQTSITADKATAGKTYANQKNIRVTVKGPTPDGSQVVLVSEKGRETLVPPSYLLFEVAPIVADADTDLTAAQCTALVNRTRAEIEPAVLKMTDDQLEAFAAADGRMFVLDLVGKEQERRSAPATEPEVATVAPAICGFCDATVPVSVSPISGASLLAPHKDGAAYCAGSGKALGTAPSILEKVVASVAPSVTAVLKADALAEKAPKSPFVDHDDQPVTATDARVAMIKGWFDAVTVAEALLDPTINATVRRELERQAAALAKVKAATTASELDLIAAGDAAKARPGVRVLLASRRSSLVPPVEEIAPPVVTAKGDEPAPVPAPIEIQVTPALFGIEAPAAAEPTGLAILDAAQAAASTEPAPEGVTEEDGVLVDASPAHPDADPSVPLAEPDSSLAEDSVDDGARSAAFMAGRDAFAAGAARDVPDAYAYAQDGEEAAVAEARWQDWLSGWDAGQALVMAEPGFVKQAAPPVEPTAPVAPAPTDGPEWMKDDAFWAYLQTNRAESGRELYDHEAELVWRLSKDVRTSRAAMPEAKEIALVQRALEFAESQKRSQTVIDGLQKKAANLAGSRKPGPKPAAAAPKPAPVADQDGDEAPLAPVPTGPVTSLANLPIEDQIERSSIPRALELVEAITDVRVLREADKRSLYPEVHAAIEARRRQLMPGTTTWSGSPDTVKIVEAKTGAPAPEAQRRFQVKDCRLVRLPDGREDVWACPDGEQPFLVGPASRGDIAPLAAHLRTAATQSIAPNVNILAAQNALAGLAAGLPALKALGISVTITITT